MPSFDFVIRNGVVATAADAVTCDIGINDGKVTALGLSLEQGKEELDASGMIVTPGGVDSHCHLDQPTNDGSKMADDFESGTLSAAFGGTTTVVPFACQMKGQGLRAAVTDYHSRAEGKAYIDYAFHLIISDANQNVIGQELPSLIKDGYTSFKVYMTYADLKLDDKEILNVLEVARQEGGMTMIHAENSDCIEWLTERLVNAGNTLPKHHATSRPAPVEREATHRAVTLSEVVNVPVLIVHVSGRDAIDQIREGQSRGARVLGETCPQYLFLTADDLDLDGFEGAKHVCSPPPRDEANQEAVWNALVTGVLQVFSSDHAPFRFDDQQGKKLKGESTPFHHVPNGIPGLETRMPLLFSEGVGKGRITLQQFVQLTATNAAQTYGLYPRKGTIAVGSDADIAIWDPNRRVTLTNDMLHHNVDYTPYEGMQLTGWPIVTMSRGEIVCRDGTLLADKGRGVFLPCNRPALIKPARV